MQVYGTKYCKDSPTIEEEKLQNAVVAAINTMLDGKEKIKSLLNGSIAEILMAPDVEKEILGLNDTIRLKNEEIVEIIKKGVENREDRATISEKCKEKHDEVSKLQEQLNSATARRQMENSHTGQLREIYDAIDQIPGKFTEYNDDITRVMVSKVKILSAEKAEITLLNSVTLTMNL